MAETVFVKAKFESVEVKEESESLYVKGECETLDLYEEDVEEQDPLMIESASKRGNWGRNISPLK